MGTHGHTWGHVPSASQTHPEGERCPIRIRPCARSPPRSYVTPQLCQRFKVGARTTYTLKHHHVYVLTNATAWVEAHGGDHIHRTPNLTLYLNEAGKCRRGRAGHQHRHR